VGTVIPPIRVDNRRQSASFTLKVDDDRFFVATVGLGQYERMSAAQGSANLQLLVLGFAYSYRSHKCGQHHVGIEPLILVSLADVPGDELDHLQEIAAQWFAASLLTLNDKSLIPLASRTRRQAT
jgi:hypothetical protein